MISHDEAMTLISVRQDQRLDPMVEIELQRHLSGCSSCRAFAETTDQLTSGLRTLPYLAPSAKVRENVMAHVDRGRSPLARITRGFDFQLAPALGTFAIIALVALLGWQLLDRTNRDTEPNESENQLASRPTEVVTPTATSVGFAISTEETAPTEPTTEPPAPTDVPPTDAPTATEVPATETTVPTDVPATDTPLPTEPPSDTRASDETPVDLVGEEDVTEVPSEPTQTVATTATEGPEPTTPFEPTETVAPTAAETPKPTTPSEPTETPEPTPTETPEPTATSEPTDTPEPTPTETPEPTATSEPTATTEPATEPPAVQTQPTQPPIAPIEPIGSPGAAQAVPTETTAPPTEPPLPPTQPPVVVPQAPSPTQPMIEPIDEGTAEAGTPAAGQGGEPGDDQQGGPPAIQPIDGTEPADGQDDDQNRAGGENGTNTPDDVDTTRSLDEVSEPYGGIEGDPSGRLLLTEGKMIFGSVPDEASQTTFAGATIRAGGTGVQACLGDACTDITEPTDQIVTDTPLAAMPDGALYQREVNGGIEIHFVRLSGSEAVDDSIIFSGGVGETVSNPVWAQDGVLYLLTDGGLWMSVDVNGTVTNLGMGDPNPQLVRFGAGMVGYVSGGNLVIAPVSQPGQAMLQLPFGGVDFDFSPDGDRVAISSGTTIEIYDMTGALVTTYASTDVAPGTLLWLNSGIVYVDSMTGSLYQISETGMGQ